MDKAVDAFKEGGLAAAARQISDAYLDELPLIAATSLDELKDRLQSFAASGATRIILPYGPAAMRPSMKRVDSSKPGETHRAASLSRRAHRCVAGCDLVGAKRCGLGAGAFRAADDVVVEQLDVGATERHAGGQTARLKVGRVADDVAALLGAGPHLGAAQAGAGSAVILAIDAGLVRFAARVAANRAAPTVLGARRAILVTLALAVAARRAISAVAGTGEAALAPVGITHAVAACFAMAAIGTAGRAVFAEALFAEPVAAPEARPTVLRAGLASLVLRIADVVAAGLADSAVLGAASAVFTSGIAHAVSAGRRSHDDLGVGQLSLSTSRLAADDVGCEPASVAHALIGSAGVSPLGAGRIASSEGRERQGREKGGANEEASRIRRPNSPRGLVVGVQSGRARSMCDAWCGITSG